MGMKDWHGEQCKHGKPVKFECHDCVKEELRRATTFMENLHGGIERDIRKVREVLQFLEDTKYSLSVMLGKEGE